MKMITILTGLILLLTSGCGSEMATGAAAGVGVGALLQNTIMGAKADLKAQEERLIKTYNEGVTIGAKQEDLDAIAKAIEQNQQMQQGAEAGEQFFSLNWNDPKQTGMAFGNLIELGLIFWGGRKLKRTVAELKGTQAGINKFNGTHDRDVAGQLYDVVKEKLAINGIRV